MNQKSTGMAYLLCIVPSLFFIAGIHRFYLGKIGTGILYLLTFGWFGIGIIYDLFTLPNQIRMANLLRNGGTLNQVKQDLTINNQPSQNVVINFNTESLKAMLNEEEKKATANQATL